MTSPDISEAQTSKDRSTRSKFLLLAAATIGPGVMLGFTLASLGLLLDTPEADACRDRLEWNIETPSTIENFEATIEQAEAGTIDLSYRGEECAAVGWPDKVCDVLTAFPRSLAPNAAEDPAYAFSSPQEARKADMEIRREAYQSLSPEQRDAFHIQASFDAENTYGAPIRHEATCIVKESPITGEPVILATHFHRGF